MICSTLLSLLILRSLDFANAREDCPCGYQLAKTGDIFTHKMFYDFTRLSDAGDMLKDGPAEDFIKDWIVYDFWQNSDNPSIRLNAKYDYHNVEIKDGNLVLKQKAYSEQDLRQFKPVSISGIQSKSTDILHGTFTAELKLVGYNGGSCASFFWYHDDRSEIDIEVVTPGNSFVNDTINYTTHPSLAPDGTKIANATYSVPLNTTVADFKIHRFDCNPLTGVQYYLNNEMIHTDNHNIPRAGGSLQLKLWADGNKWWSGLPSKTDVELHVRSLIAYYNTSSSIVDTKWARNCAKSNKKPCNARLERVTPPNGHVAPIVPFETQPPSLPTGYLPSTNKAASIVSNFLPTALAFTAFMLVA